MLYVSLSLSIYIYIYTPPCARWASRPRPRCIQYGIVYDVVVQYIVVH